jgi:transcriptional regulator of acetoin/glycerol metabolism
MRKLTEQVKSFLQSRSPQTEDPDLAGYTFKDLEKMYLQQLYDQTNGNQSEAGRRSGLDRKRIGRRWKNLHLI